MRFLIIVFALAIVCIGLYPFRREFRAQFQEVRAIVRRELGEYTPNGGRAAESRGSLSRPAGGRGDQERKAAEERRTADRSRPRQGSAGASEAPEPESDHPAPGKSLDRLSEDDRRALDRLLNR